MDVKHERKEKSNGLYEVVVTFTGPEKDVKNSVKELEERVEKELGRKPDIIIMDEVAYTEWAKQDVES